MLEEANPSEETLPNEKPLEKDSSTLTNALYHK
jgi:hypothetical protein